MFFEKCFIFLIVAYYFLSNSCVNSSCVGKHEQSMEMVDRIFKPLVLKGLATHPDKIVYKNNGQTVVMKYKYKDKSPTIEGGPFGSETYRLAFMYYHWLNTSNDELLVDDDHIFPVRLHVVWFNKRYENYEAALKKDLAVAITVFQHRIIPDATASTIESFYKPIEGLTTPSTAIEVTDEINLSSFLNVSTVFAVYVGKQIFEINPNCYDESDVIWIEFDTRIVIKPNQIKFFNNLLGSNNLPLMSKIITFSPPNSTIYFTDIDYFSRGIEAIPAFEGFTFGFDTASFLVVNKKMLALIIFLFIYLCYN